MLKKTVLTLIGSPAACRGPRRVPR